MKKHDSKTQSSAISREIIQEKEIIKKKKGDREREYASKTSTLKKTCFRKWATTTQRKRSARGLIGWGFIEAALTGYELGRSKKYKRRGAAMGNVTWGVSQKQ